MSFVCNVGADIKVLVWLLFIVFLNFSFPTTVLPNFSFASFLDKLT